MSIWKRMFGGWRASRSTDPANTTDSGQSHLDLARESLRELLDDQRLPGGVREALADDYRAVRAMLDKLEHGHLHIAVFGRVSTGKSSLLNALIGEQRFSVSALHGETRRADMQRWQEEEAAGIFFIDTPGINEVGGEQREALAEEVAGRADLILFVVDGDLTESEHTALSGLAQMGRPVLLILNKADRYTASEREALLAALRSRCAGLIDADHVLTTAANPAPRTVIQVDEHGNEAETERPGTVDVAQLKETLWQVLEREGKTLAALNATLFASDLSDKVAQRIIAARQQLAEKVVRMYCLAKGVAVGLNPVPVADLFAAAFVDVGMIMHLSRIYGLPLTEREAGSLIKVVIGQAAALMGTVWAVHFVSSALKVGTGGLSTFVTASIQGAIAWYSTYVVGRVAERYLAQGKSWGDGGPKTVVREILDSLDRDSLLSEARDEIRGRLSSRS